MNEPFPEDCAWILLQNAIIPKVGQVWKINHYAKEFFIVLTDISNVIEYRVAKYADGKINKIALR
jgi:hypothetical protein